MTMPMMISLLHIIQRHKEMMLLAGISLHLLLNLSQLTISMEEMAKDGILWKKRNTKLLGVMKTRKKPKRNLNLKTSLMRLKRNQLQHQYERRRVMILLTSENKRQPWKSLRILLILTLKARRKRQKTMIPLVLMMQENKPSLEVNYSTSWMNSQNLHLYLIL